MDHVMPKAQSGEHRWENVVLSCITCNNLKADRTPEEAGMELIDHSVIVKPTRWHMEKLKGNG